jgi:hypothetical protein
MRAALRCQDSGDYQVISRSQRLSCSKNETILELGVFGRLNESSEVFVLVRMCEVLPYAQACSSVPQFYED